MPSIFRTFVVLSVIFFTFHNAVVLAEQPASYEAGLVEGQAHLDHGEHTADHEKKAGLPQLDPTWFPSQAFWLFFSFMLMYAIFSRKVLPDISSSLENRREQIQSDLDTAEDLKEKAEEAHQRYDELMNGAYEQSRDMIHQNDDAMKASYNEAMEKFRQKSSDQITKLEKDLDKMKTKAKKDMHDIAADLATQAADKIAGVKADKKDMKSILDSIDKKAA